MYIWVNDLMEEIWKPVKGFEGIYEVSNIGRVHHISTQRIKKASVTKNGYNYVALWKNNKHKHMLLHRLIAIAFIPNPLKKSQVNHKDGNKLNNALENLEWVTHQENGVHAYKTGLTRKPPGNNKRGTEVHSAVLNELSVLEIRNKFDSGRYTQKELGNMYGVTRSGIQSITRRKTWKHV